jgi:hypothetical protein
LKTNIPLLRIPLWKLQLKEFDPTLQFLTFKKTVSMKKFFTMQNAEEMQAYIIAWAFFSTMTVFALLFV